MNLRTPLLSLAVAATVAAVPLVGDAFDVVSVEATPPTGSAGAELRAALAEVPALTAGQPPALDPISENFELVGHNDLNMRGMNAALAIHGDYAYVGSRTDGKSVGDLENVNGAGVLVVDISDPANMSVVGEIGPPFQGLTDQTSREMRVWPEQEVLIVMNLSSNCSEIIHGCAPAGGAPDEFSFYDISGENAANPVHIASYDPSINPHEFYLWVDPEDTAGRALLYVSGTSGNAFYVTDISGWRTGEFVELGILPEVDSIGGRLHSMTPDYDGRTTYLANLKGGTGVIDTSDFAAGVADPQFDQLTEGEDAPRWPGEGAHSAVRLPGRDVMIVGDEVYGDLLTPAFGEHGCPWGWMRTVDTSDPTAPEVVGEFRLSVNEESFCDTDVPRPSSSYAAHNPTVTDELIFITWHAGGLRAISIEDPTQPKQEGAYIPEPIPAVVQEDPALTAGQDKVAFWSFPIIKDGIIYVVDVRNGLYALRYTGYDAEDVASISFLEGNSNVGDAARYAEADEDDQGEDAAGQTGNDG